MAIKIYPQALILVITLLSFSSCQKIEADILQARPTGIPDLTENGTNPDEASIPVVFDSAEHKGYFNYVYTQGNEAGRNTIYIYVQHTNGRLTYKESVASGGAGNATKLGSQGALALSADHKWLFAVNAGDNSVSSFLVHRDGTLTLSGTVASGGITPVSVCVYNNYLYVVNATTSNIAGYTINEAGKMTAMAGANLLLSSPIAGPAQISFKTSGGYLYVTEKATNKITSFKVSAGGLATADMSVAATGERPFGFGFARDNFMVVSNANAEIPNGSSCTSYAGIGWGNLSAVNGAVANDQTTSGWVATTKHGRYAYVTNTGSDNISTYYIGELGELHLVHASAISTGSQPTDICIAGNNYYVYCIDAKSHSISGYRRAPQGGLIANGSISGLPDFASGLVAW